MEQINSSFSQRMLERVAEVRFYRALHHILIQQIGLLPSSLDRKFLGRVVDLACGPGFWVRDIAALYPHKDVIGVDHDVEMIACALDLTPTTLELTQFLRDDITESVLRGPCAGLVHARFLSTIITLDEWADWLPVWLNLCYDGGHFIWTEARLETTSTVWHTLFSLVHLAMGVGAVESHESRTLDVTPVMEHLLAETRCLQIKRSVREVDLSFGSAQHKVLRQHQIEVMSLIQPFLFARSITGQDEIEHICREALAELENESLKARLSIVTVIGKLPERPVEQKNALSNSFC